MNNMQTATTFLFILLMAFLLKRSLLTTRDTSSSIRAEQDDSDTILPPVPVRVRPSRQPLVGPTRPGHGKR